MANSIEYIYEVIDRFSGPLRKFDRAVENNSAKLRRFSRDMGRAGKDITTSLTLPIVGLGGAAAYAFGNFEAAMSSVSTLIDTNVESIDDMSKAVLDISRRAPVAISDLTSALYDVRSAGIPAANQFEVLEGSARLAIAGLGTTSQSVGIVTSALNAFRLEGEDASRIYDIIFSTVKGGKTNISELSRGFGAVAGQVADAGIEVDEFMAAVSAMTTTGMKAAITYTQIRAVIAGLTRVTPETAKVFNSLGVKTFKGLIKKSGGLVGALESVRGVVGDNDEMLLKMLGSTEALSAVLSLTGAQSGAFNSIIADMRDGSESVSEAFDKQSRTFNSSMVRAKNAIERLGIVFGVTLAPYITAVSDKISYLSEKLENLSPDARKLIVAVALILAAIGPLLMAFAGIGVAVSYMAIGLKVVATFAAPIALVAGAVVNFVLALRAGYTAMAALNIVMAANPIGLVILGIAALVALGYVLYNNWDAVTEVFGRVWQWIKDTAAAMGKLVSVIPDWIFGGGNMSVEHTVDNGSGNTAQKTANRRERQNTMRVDGSIGVRGENGATVTESNINLNGGSNVATAQ